MSGDDDSERFLTWETVRRELFTCDMIPITADDDVVLKSGVRLAELELYMKAANPQTIL